MVFEKESITIRKSPLYTKEVINETYERQLSVRLRHHREGALQRRSVAGRMGKRSRRQKREASRGGDQRYGVGNFHSNFAVTKTPTGFGLAPIRTLIFFSLLWARLSNPAPPFQNSSYNGDV